jgi:AraC family transcriptional regulator
LPRADRRVHTHVENDQHVAMADRLRELIDVVLDSLDEPANGASLARRAHFSRDHLDRLLAAATGESPVALRRRLLLERAAWQLRTDAASPSEAATAAGYGSLAAFSRAFARAYGAPPSAFAGELQLDAPNGIHFHPPAGLLIPTRPGPGRGDLTDRLVSHHLDRVRELLAVAATLPPEALERDVRPGFVAVWFEGEEASAALMMERLVYTLEVWVAAIEGEPVPSDGGDLAPRFERAARDFERLAKRIRDRGAFDDAFVDALCEPPQSFTYGGVLAHVLSYGAIRREALASVLSELGADVPASGDPIEWEAQSARTRMSRNATTS